MATIDDHPSPQVVCDAGPLIHLDELGCLDLLADFPTIFVAPTVWQEVLRHRPAALIQPGIAMRQTAAVAPAPPELDAVAKLLSLHKGEFEALRLALDHRPALLLTDDTAARLAAANLGITVHGTIGILIRAIRRNHRSRSEILSILQTLPSKSTLHLKPSLLSAVIARVEQSRIAD